MYSKAKLFGHPIHPMLVAFPVAFYTATVVTFIVYASTQDTFWFRFATISSWVGVVSAGAAALPGFVDWLAIPRTSRAKGVGLQHLALNVVALTSFLVCAIVSTRSWNEPLPPADGSLLLAAIGLCATAGAGFLGWTLVQDHHVGVRLSAAQEQLQPELERELGRKPPDREPQGPASFVGR
ncbi:MAG TPA: DUF2231 domain-containing protein [Polyangiaceae bacterium]|nr:DUF2231 domain-containing protein [Polyangiaceae bacterium]